MYYFFSLGARWGAVISATAHPIYPWENHLHTLNKLIFYCSLLVMQDEVML